MSDEVEKPSLPSDDDVKARFAKIREELHAMDLPELPDDEHLRAEIQSLTAQGRITRMPDVPELPGKPIQRPNSPSSSKSYDYKGLGLGMTAAYSLVGAMAVGFGLGWLYDRSTGSSAGAPVGALLGCVLGIVSAVILIFRINGNGK